MRVRPQLFLTIAFGAARVVADTPIDEGIVVDMEKSMFFNIYCACWPISEDYQKVSNQAPGFLRDGIITQPSAQFVRELHACDVYEYLTPEDRRTLETQCPPELLWNEGTNKMDHTPKDDDMRDSREEYEEMDDSNDEFAQLSSNESSEDGFRAVSEEDEDMVDDNEQSMADRESGVSYDSDGHPLVPVCELRGFPALITSSCLLCSCTVTATPTIPTKWKTKTAMMNHMI
jgi:hypothetical protein